MRIPARSWTAAALIGLLTTLISPAARALTVSWDGVAINSAVTQAEGYLPSGTAVFSINGAGQLQVVVSATGDPETYAPQILTGLTFELPTGITLTPVSATAEDVIYGDGTNPNPNTAEDVGAYWIYDSSLVSPGIGSVGVFAVFQVYGDTELVTQVAREGLGYVAAWPPGPGDTADCMDGTTCALAPINGSNYGIVGDNFSGGLPAGFSGVPFVQNTVTFTWSISGGTLDPDADISGVSAVFGQKGQPLLPEPGSVAVFSIGLLTAGALIRRLRAEPD